MHSNVNHVQTTRKHKFGCTLSQMSHENNEFEMQPTGDGTDELCEPGCGDSTEETWPMKLSDAAAEE